MKSVKVSPHFSLSLPHWLCWESQAWLPLSLSVAACVWFLLLLSPQSPVELRLELRNFPRPPLSVNLKYFFTSYLSWLRLTWLTLRNCNKKSSQLTSRKKSWSTLLLTSSTRDRERNRLLKNPPQGKIRSIEYYSTSAVQFKPQK